MYFKMAKSICYTTENAMSTSLEKLSKVKPPCTRRGAAQPIHKSYS